MATRKLADIVEAQRNINRHMRLAVEANQGTYDDARRSYYESWLHEVGHLLPFTEGRLVAPSWPESASAYLSQSIQSCDPFDSDLNEAYALATTIAASRLLGHPVAVKSVCHPDVNLLRYDWVWVTRKTKELLETNDVKRYARTIADAIEEEIRCPGHFCLEE